MPIQGSIASIWLFLPHLIQCTKGTAVTENLGVDNEQSGTKYTAIFHSSAIWCTFPLLFFNFVGKMGSIST
jgi:hypothetical protein